MKQTKKISSILLLVVVLAFCLNTATFAGPARAQTTETPPAFSIIWISDTQYLAEVYPAYYDNLCQWIVDNTGAYDVKMVVHTGDIVNVPTSQTQWTNANHSMGILLDNGVPYCWDAGNHDFDIGYWFGNQYYAFNPEAFQSEPYWISDIYDGMNTAVHFDVAGWECLIINLCYNANDTTLEWANNLLDTCPNAHAIVATHAYIDQFGNYNTWATHLKTAVLDPHPNVFLTLSGHFHPGFGYRTQVGNRHELFFNQQDVDTQKGGAAARILTFSLPERTLDVQTYNVYTATFNTDTNNQFTLDISGAVPEGLFVVPEYQFGLVSAVAAPFAAAAVFGLYKRSVSRGWRIF
jgi:hypothetical protein